MNLSPKVKHQRLDVGNNHYFFNSKYAPDFSENYFSSDFWQQQQAIVGKAQGRGTTWFIQHQQQQWVLKHYYRGGMVGKLLKDSYLFTGMENTRSLAEFNLLLQLNALSLPAPIPIACSIERSAMCYRADILTSRIEHAEDLVGILSKQAIDDRLWLEIGRTIKKFHQHGVYHHDLNIHNILIDHKERVWLIDFDRGCIKVPATQWQQANISRLERSFNKELTRLDQFNWQSANFTTLISGYTR